MEELKRMRNELGWSQQKLADVSGVNKATINQVEQGKRSPSIETLEKLARAMGAEIGDFFPKLQAPLPLSLEPEPPAERGYSALTRQLEDWRYLFERSAERWEREAKGSLFDTADGALAYSIEAHIESAQFFEIIVERLLPTMDAMLPKGLAEAERRKLDRSTQRLEEATASVTEATRRAVPGFDDDLEFSEAELASIDEAIEAYEALPEIEKRRRAKEVEDVLENLAAQGRAEMKARSESA